VRDFAMELRRYGVRAVVGDRFAGSWPQAAFRKWGVNYREAELPKTNLYREAMPAFASGRVELPDNPVLKRQLLGLERRVTASGREAIDHGQAPASMTTSRTSWRASSMSCARSR